MRPANSHRRRRQRGTAAMEFAIALPLLLLVMLATAELGRLMSQANTLAKQVRDGVRYAAAGAAVGTTRVVSITPQLSTAVANLVVTGQISGGSPLLPGLNANMVTVADAGNGYVSVSATYPYQPMVGGSLSAFGLGAPVSLALPLTATVIMRAL